MHGHDDVIKWKHFPSYWPFVQGIHRSPVNSPHNGQWCGALMFSLPNRLFSCRSNTGDDSDLRLPSRSLWCHCNGNWGPRAMVSYQYTMYRNSHYMYKNQPQNNLNFIMKILTLCKDHLYVETGPRLFFSYGWISTTYVWWILRDNAKWKYIIIYPEKQFCM